MLNQTLAGWISLYGILQIIIVVIIIFSLIEM